MLLFLLAGSPAGMPAAQVNFRPPEGHGLELFLIAGSGVIAFNPIRRNFSDAQSATHLIMQRVPITQAMRLMLASKQSRPMCTRSR
jgi:hypothetical protein